MVSARSSPRVSMRSPSNSTRTGNDVVVAEASARVSSMDGNRPQLERLRQAAMLECRTVRVQRKSCGPASYADDVDRKGEVPANAHAARGGKKRAALL